MRLAVRPLAAAGALLLSLSACGCSPATLAVKDAYVRLPAVPGHPPAAVLAYLPVPYEDFDMSGAPVLPTSWRVGDPSPFGDPGAGGPSPVQARPDGTFVVDERYTGGGTTLEVTTRGRGRLRVLADVARGAQAQLLLSTRPGAGTHWRLTVPR